MGRLPADMHAWGFATAICSFVVSCARTDLELAPNDGPGDQRGGTATGAGFGAGARSGSGSGAAASGGDGGVMQRGGRGGAVNGSGRGGVANRGGSSGIAGRGGASARGGRSSSGASGGAGASGSGGLGGLGTAGNIARGGAGSAGASGEGGSSHVPAAATALALGAFHTCAVFDNGRLRCWGGAGYIGSGNDLTIGDDETPSVLPDVDIGGGVVQIAAGWYQTCAVLDGGRVRCFGVAAGGLLGYANAENIGDDETPASAGDVDVGGSVTQIAAGPQHTCARLANGTVTCWGSNSHYQLGNRSPGNIGDNETPASTGIVFVGGSVEQVVVGFSHTCALLAGGAVRCWGEGSNGCLGYGNTNTIGDDEEPADAGDVDLGGDAVELAAGSFHTCALLTTGNVRCWGMGYDGRLGYADTRNIGDDETPADAGDVDVGGPVLHIAAGDYSTCALLVGGSVRCWGAGSFGELGYADTANIGDNETPAAAGDVDLGGPATSIDVGFQHTCATLESGAIRCWGRASDGELGYGNTDAVGDDETPASAGDVHALPD